MPRSSAAAVPPSGVYWALDMLQELEGKKVGHYMFWCVCMQWTAVIAVICRL